MDNRLYILERQIVLIFLVYRYLILKLRKNIERDGWNEKELYSNLSRYALILSKI